MSDQAKISFTLAAEYVFKFVSSNIDLNLQPDLAYIALSCQADKKWLNDFFKKSPEDFAERIEKTILQDNNPQIEAVGYEEDDSLNLFLDRDQEMLEAHGDLGELIVFCSEVDKSKNQIIMLNGKTLGETFALNKVQVRSR